MGRGFDDDTPDGEFLGLLGLRERMKRIFDEHAAASETEGMGAQLGWNPPVDILETGSSFLLTAEVPGVGEEDIDVKIVGDTLILRGERNPDPAEKIVHYHRVERHEGMFQRAFRLPSDVDPDGIHAVCAEGVLRVEIPKRFPAQAKTIEIQGD